MTWPVMLAVLGGALLHAGWNALIKSGADKALDTALIAVMAALLALPVLLWAGPPPAAAWPYVAASALIHVGYYAALAGAYRHGELGLTYPVMRGLAPLLVALAGATLTGEAPRPAAWAGIAAIAAGVMLVGLARPAELAAHRRALVFAVANAAVIAAYTVVDGRGVRLCAGVPAGSLRYALLLFAVDGVASPLWVAWRRDAAGRRALLRHARGRWPVCGLGGAASIGAYAIALWAMTRAPVASVAALRETSVLFAAGLGTWLLNERFGLARGLGTATVVAGVMALRFA